MAALRLLLLLTLTKTNLRNYFERQNCKHQIIFHEEQNSRRKPSNSVKLTVIILLATCSTIGYNVRAALRLLLLQSLTKTNLLNFFER